MALWNRLFPLPAGLAVERPRRIRPVRRSSARRDRPTLRTAAVVEVVEPRRLLTTFSLTPQEQYFVELINRARANPVAEANRLGIDLNDDLPAGTLTGEARQPLAPNQTLNVGAERHSRDMLTQNYFSHTGRDGSSPTQRVERLGYDGVAAENIAYRGGFPSLNRDGIVDRLHRDLWDSASHRQGMLVSGRNYREVGLGLEDGTFRARGTDGVVRDFDAAMVTELFGRSTNGRRFVTGVVFDDANSGSLNNGFYNIGEGLGGGLVVARNVATGQEYTGRVQAAGGYAVLVPDGEYTVQLRQNGDRFTAAGSVSIAGLNAKVDFDFDRLTPDSPPPQGPTTGQDVIGRVAATGQWWVAASNGSTLDNRAVGRWLAVDYDDVADGDFDGDGRQDVYGRTAGAAHFVGLSTEGGLATSKWTQWGTGIDWGPTLVGDFNADGKDDILVRHGGNGAWFVGISTGRGFATRFAGHWNKNVDWTDVQVADFDGDGTPDIAGRIVGNGAWWVSTSDGGNGGRFPRLTNSFYARWDGRVDWQGVHAADFNGDGRVDLSGFNPASGQLFVAENSGSRFATRQYGRFAGNVPWEDWVVGDFTGDGAADLAARHGGTGSWFAATSTTSGGRRLFRPEGLQRWSPGVDWVDVTAFNIDHTGKDEILGRDQTRGNWWVVEASPNGGYRNRFVGRWGGGDIWADVRTLDYDGRPASTRAATSVAGLSPSATGAPTATGAPAVGGAASTNPGGTEDAAALDELFADASSVRALTTLEEL